MSKKWDKDELKEIFLSNADYCDCESQDCDSNHRKCSWCGDKMQFGEYVGFHDGKEHSAYSWDIDHRQPKYNNGNDKFKNLQPMHPWCNKEKANKSNY